MSIPLVTLQDVSVQFNGKRTMELVSREAAASPAVGFKKKHDQQQAEVVAKAFE